MRELVKQYPDDLDAATLFAEAGMNLHPWGLWHADGTPEEGTEEIVATLESVIRRDPNHWARFTTTFTLWKVPTRRSARWQGRIGWRKWLPLRDTSCICLHTFTSAPATTKPR